jgi:phenylacetate-CoA ligase
VPPGQLSHTTLLTNLANHLQPLIRFDIGDRIALGGERCPCGCALPVVQVQGRSDDAIVLRGADGAPVTLLPLALTTVLEDEAGVFDFELRQLGPQRLRLALGPRCPVDAALQRRCKDALTAFARSQGALPPALSVTHLAAAPASASGKVKRIVAVDRHAVPPDHS